MYLPKKDSCDNDMLENLMRYKFYREHKYVCAAINDVERLIAKTDFASENATTKVTEAFDVLLPMLRGHADYESSRLHRLLREKGSDVYRRVEKEHQDYEQIFNELNNRLMLISQSRDPEERIELGYQLYIWFRKFAGDNLLHLHEEETVILPELQKLYTDQELSQVEFESYRLMSSEDLIHMMQTLFPHMNPSDRLVFLTDIKACDEEKFARAWLGIRELLDQDERKLIEIHLA